MKNEKILEDSEKALDLGSVTNSTSALETLEKRIDAVEYWEKLVYDGEISLRQALLGMSYVAETGF